MDVQDRPFPSERPFRWSTERFLALVESGIVPEGRGIELIGGQVIESMPQGQLHFLLFSALQRVFAASGGFERGLVVSPTVVLLDGNVFDPEFAFLRPQYSSVDGLPSAADTLLVVEVSVSSIKQDLGPKRADYCAAGVPLYWVVDGTRDGIWSFSDPSATGYLSESFISADGEIDIPFIGERIRLSEVFSGARKPVPGA